MQPRFGHRERGMQARCWGRHTGTWMDQPQGKGRPARWAVYVGATALSSGASGVGARVGGVELARLVDSDLQLGIEAPRFRLPGMGPAPWGRGY